MTVPGRRLTRSRNKIIASNVLTLSDDGLAATGRVPAGYLYVDGIVGDVGHGVLRDRRVLSEEGVVVVVITVDMKTGEVVSGPEIITRGWVHAPDAEPLLDEARQVVRGALEKLDHHGGVELDQVQRSARQALGRFVNDRTKRRPMIVPVVMEV